MSFQNHFSAIQMQQIRHFIALVETSSFHRAAELMNISQPGLTRSIQRLEAAVNGKLIERTSRGVAVNAYGRALYAYALKVVNETRQLEAQLEELRQETGGVIRVGLAANFTDVGLAGLLGDFALANRHCRVILTQGFYSDVMLRNLRLGELDLAIGLWPSSSVTKDLVVEKLTTSTSSVVCGPASRFYDGEEATLDALSQTPWVVTGLNEVEAYLAKAFLTHGAAPPSQFLHTNSVEAQRSLLISRDWVTLMPNRVLDGLDRFSPLKRLHTPLGQISSDAVLVYPEAAQHTSHHKALIKSIKARYQAGPARTR